MRLNNIGTRLAAVYAVLFCISVAILGLVSAWLMDAALRRQIDTRITAEMVEISAKQPLKPAVLARVGNQRGLKLRLETASGELIAGNLPPMGHQSGWFNFGVTESNKAEAPDIFRGLAQSVGETVLIVAADTDEIENMRDILAVVFGLTAIAAALLAVPGGLWLSRYFMSRLNHLADAAQAITDGDFSRRMPVGAGDDEFDRVSNALNQMLDRNATLLENQRQITNDIAHDIRTPLTRLRQKLEAGQSSTALEETDNLLATLTSLLRIAEIEEGERRSAFADVNLSLLVREIGETYAAIFDERGKTLVVTPRSEIFVQGDQKLLAQLLSNLVENVLVHTPPSTRATLDVTASTAVTRLSVSDNGPGVPESETENILRRFYQLDQSRHSGGNGLGLSLVNAIAKLHKAELRVENLHPGLSVTVLFSATRQNR